MESTANRSTARTALGLLAAVLVIGLGVRLWDLDRRGFCHPENFVSGIAVPSWVVHPPERLTFRQILETTPRDGHPPLYFLALHPWICAFGTGLFALRLPSALLGAATLLLLWRIARRESGPWIALLAVALLALNGHHVFWSQMARMYAPAAFLCVLSTWLLWRLVERPSWARTWLYGVAATAGLWTHVYCWPILLGQILWGVARAIRRRGPAVALNAQLVAIMASIPVLTLAMYQSPKTEWADPKLEFFELGYLFYSQAQFFGDAPAPPVPHGALLGLGALLIGLAIFAWQSPARDVADADAGLGHADGERPARGSALLQFGFATAMSVILAWLAWSWFGAGSRRRIIAFGIAAVPLAIAAAIPFLHGVIARLGARQSGWIAAAARKLERPSLVLALLPIACLLLVSLGRAAFTARGMLVSVPFLCILLAQGIGVLWRWRPLGVLATALVLSLHLLSLVYFHRAESSPRDYRGFASALAARLEPDDLIFVHNHYSDPPLLYYLPDRHDRFVPADYAAAARAAPRSRIWMILYEDQTPSPEMLFALAGYEEREPAQAWNCRARLFVAK